MLDCTLHSLRSGFTHILTPASPELGQIRLWIIEMYKSYLQQVNKKLNLIFVLVFFPVIFSSHHYPSMVGPYCVPQFLLILAYKHTHCSYMIADSVSISCSAGCVEYLL